eukprot:2322937-Prymnesium_polylepis.1
MAVAVEPRLTRVVKVVVWLVELARQVAHALQRLEVGFRVADERRNPETQRLDGGVVRRQHGRLGRA